MVVSGRDRGPTMEATRFGPTAAKSTSTQNTWCGSSIRNSDTWPCSISAVSLESRSFPVPENALQSLPPGLRGILEEQGYLQTQREYDKTTQEFVDVLLMWEVAPEEPLDDLMKMVKELDGWLAPAISYMMYTYGPERWADPGIIAGARGIEESTVREQIENAKADLPERFQELD
jgi:hypothetical protein